MDPNQRMVVILDTYKPIQKFIKVKQTKKNNAKVKSGIRQMRRKNVLFKK